ncbi:hypothetical protein ACFRMQ_16190 [Kitasatospora sp. NPDC056783]|uniref:hypothetical protein n=1 Tax=Kitasatospora sp. NPDC056783 TaxID=3345943 RepID=UPI00369FB2CF
MRTSSSGTRRLGVVAVLALLVGLMGFAPQASATTSATTSATPPYFALSVDHPTLTPGQSGTLNVTFTNRQTSPVTFLYVWLPLLEAGPQPAPGARAVLTGCSGQVSWCDLGERASVQGLYALVNLTAPQVPIEPGGSRTITLTYRYPADSDCTVHPVVSFSTNYFHYEYGDGSQSYDGSEFPDPPVTSTLVCPPAP